MPNKHYMKGYRKERKLVNEARAEGYLAFRSAGSHSPVDVVIVRQHGGTIDLIQCKSDNISVSKRKKLMKRSEEIDGYYYVRFKVE